MSSDLEADRNEATLEIVEAVNARLNSTMKSYQDLLDSTGKDRDQMAQLKIQVQHLSYGLMALMQKHRYTQCRVTLGQMRQNQNSGNIIDVQEEIPTESVKFEITQIPFSYKEHLHDVGTIDFAPDSSGRSGDRKAISGSQEGASES